MATSLPAASVAPVTKTQLPFNLRYLCRSKLSFPPSSKPKLRFSSKVLQSKRNHPIVVKAQLNEVAVNGPSNTVASPSTELEVPASEEKDAKQVNETSPEALIPEPSISEFIAQVKNLVKLVDSRDIVELQMKQLGCELIIRKKEALPQPNSPAPVYMMHSMSPPSITPSAPPVASPTASGPSPSIPSTPPPAPTPAKSSLPPLKCPMAGTLYRSPAPGEPAFVKVGDKVQKGQVLCIIEAMKLMNEIEADQSGTVVDILVDDGKPVSVDMPLFVIEP